VFRLGLGLPMPGVLPRQSGAVLQAALAPCAPMTDRGIGEVRIGAPLCLLPCSVRPGGLGHQF